MKVISVFKTHFDIGFTDLAENVMDTLSTQMVKEVLKVCRETAGLPKTERYVWTMPSAPLKYLLESEKISPEDKAELISFIEQDQIVWHALPFTLHTEFCGIDELIYGLQVSKELCDRFNKRRVAAKMTDVPGHTWILPTLLNAAGINFLHLGCNPASMPPDVPNLFWWEGPDGSRVLTMYAKGGYGSGVIPPENWDFPVWLSMEMTNDNQGPHTAEILSNMRKELKEFDAEAEMICGTLDDFYEAILPYTENLPVVRKDLADTWIHGVGTYPLEVSKIRMLRSKLAALQNICGVLPKGNISFKEALHNLLMFGEHTWGCDVKIYLPKRKYDKKEFTKQLGSDTVSFAEASWNEQRGYALKAEKAIESIYGKLSGKGENSIVFSAGGFDYEQWVNLGADYTEYSLNGRPLATVSSINGREICIPKAEDERFLVLEKTIASDAFVSSSVELSQNDDKIEITTPYNRAVFSKKNGYLLELYRNGSDYNYIASPESPYLYEVFGAEDISEFQKNYLYNPLDWALKDFGKENYPPTSRHKTYIPEFSGLDIKQYDNSICLTMKYLADTESLVDCGNARKIKVSYTFYGFKENIDVKCELKDKQPTSLIEAGYFVLPLANGNTQFSLSRLGSVINPERDIEKCCNTRLYCLESFVNANQNGSSATVFAEDMPLLSIGEPGILRFRREYAAPQKNTLYFNLFNNQWGTNFPQWMSGNFCYSYRIITGEGTVEENVSKAEFFAKKPVLIKNCTSLTSLPQLKLPSGIELIRFDKKSANEWHLVVKEYKGKRNEAEFNFSQFSKVYGSNLLAEREAELKKEFKLNVAPFEFKSFICIK